MSDRLKGVIVTFDRDYRECDDAESILTAIKMVKGVASVQPLVSDHVDQMARVADAFIDKLYDHIKELRKTNL